MFSQKKVILFTIGNMATWSLLILVTVWSVRILLECFLVFVDDRFVMRLYFNNVFQDEMLLFMEYCSEGTVADAAKLGLSEEMIRKYTCGILYAISVLHDKGVVHRDIKGNGKAL